MQNLKFITSLLSLIVLLSMNCTPTNAQQSKQPQFKIAPTEYAELTEKAIGHIERFEFSEWYKMMADDMEFYLPDGDEGTRTGIIGKQANMTFWDSYEKKSGNSKIIITNPVYIPITTKDELNYSKLTGAMVVVYLSAEFQYGAEKANVRMNWGFHYNADKKIDRVYTYYDRTPIIEASKRNFLTKNK